MNSESCQNCKFSFLLYEPGQEQVYECRRYPPMLSDENGAFRPLMSNDDWCGEWLPKING